MGLLNSRLPLASSLLLSGLTKLTSFPVTCLIAADNKLNKEDTKEMLKEQPFLLQTVSASVGAQYNPYFFQLLFESQSCYLVKDLFIKETSDPMMTNPLECFVTTWCVANSSPTSQWNFQFEDLSILVNFVNFLERFGCSMKHTHGAIVGLKVNS